MQLQTKTQRPHSLKQRRSIITSLTLSALGNLINYSMNLKKTLHRLDGKDMRKMMDMDRLHGPQIPKHFLKKSKQTTSL